MMNPRTRNIYGPFFEIYGRDHESLVVSVEDNENVTLIGKAFASRLEEITTEELFDVIREIREDDEVFSAYFENLINLDVSLYSFLGIGPVTELHSIAKYHKDRIRGADDDYETCE